MDTTATPNLVLLTPHLTRPWLAYYEPEVPQEIEVPSITLHALLEKTAGEYGANVATIYAGERLTYAQLDDQASRFAAGLRGLGVEPGDRVALLMANSPQFIIALFGSLKAGAAVVPLALSLTFEHPALRLADARPRIVVTTDDLAAQVRAAMANSTVEHLVITGANDHMSPVAGLLLAVRERRDVLSAPTMGENEHSFLDLVRNNAPQEQVEVGPGDLALILYTEGITGTPRGVALSHANVVANTCQLNAWMWDTRPERKDIFMAAVPLHTSFGLTATLFLAVMSASTMLLLPRFVPREALREMGRWRPTVFSATPALVESLLSHPQSERQDLRSLRVCLVGVAPLSVEAARDFAGLTGARVVEVYGLAESTAVTHANPVHRARREGSIGLPLPGTDAAIVDPHSNETMAPGEVGELAVRGPQVGHQYWSSEGDGAEIAREGWLLTGDMARQSDEGYFYVVSRAQDAILVGGKLVYPREVEDVLCANPNVQEVMVMGTPDKHGGEGVTAYVVLKDDSEAEEGELIQFVAGQLEEYKVPTRIEFREDLPRSATGKFLRGDVGE